MKKLLKFLFNTYVNVTAAYITVVFIIAFINSIYLLSNSDKSYCILVKKIEDFNGKYLKHERSKKEIYDKTEICIDLDNKIDNGDGKMKGKVRWVECAITDNTLERCKKLGDN